MLAILSGCLQAGLRSSRDARDQLAVAEDLAPERWQTPCQTRTRGGRSSPSFGFREVRERRCRWRAPSRARGLWGERRTRRALSLNFISLVARAFTEPCRFRRGSRPQASAQTNPSGGEGSFATSAEKTLQRRELQDHPLILPGAAACQPRFRPISPNARSSRR